MILPFRRSPLPAPWVADDLIKVDESRDDDTMVVRAELPGIDPGRDVELAVMNQMLHIAAERRTEEQIEEKGDVRRELRYGSFRRSLPLPAGTTEADVTASYKDGILEIHVPHRGRILRGRSRSHGTEPGTIEHPQPEGKWSDATRTMQEGPAPHRLRARRGSGGRSDSGHSDATRRADSHPHSSSGRRDRPLDSSAGSPVRKPEAMSWRRLTRTTSPSSKVSANAWRPGQLASGLLGALPGPGRRRRPKALKP